MIVRVGNVRGTSGQSDVSALQNLENMGRSTIIMKSRAYMTFEASSQLALPLAHGFRGMEVHFKE